MRICREVRSDAVIGAGCVRNPAFRRNDSPLDPADITENLCRNGAFQVFGERRGVEQFRLKAGLRTPVVG
jgi:hypothetical protein